MRSVSLSWLKFPHSYFFDVDRKLLDGDLTFDHLNIDKANINVFDLSQNFESTQHMADLVGFLEQHTKNFLILGPNPQYTNSHIFYFPIFYLHGLSWPQISISGKRKYTASCLNRNPHTHRKYNYVKLIEKNYKNFLITFHNLSGADESLDYTLPPATIETYNRTKDLLETSCDNDLSISHPGFTDSYCNLVTETVIHEDIFLSEKIWKPIAAGQFFLVIGPYRTMNYLRSIGVDVFDDIIDHTYDEETDWMKRIDQVHNSLQKLLAIDLDTLWNNTYERRLKNQQNFFQGNFGAHYVHVMHTMCMQFIKLLPHPCPNTDSI
jgi:hypothetical protein